MYEAFEVNLQSSITCYRGFHKVEEMGNNANIGIIGFIKWKQKNPVTKCYTQWGQNLGLS